VALGNHRKQVQSAFIQFHSVRRSDSAAASPYDGARARRARHQGLPLEP
jgi:hypothetical protein